LAAPSQLAVCVYQDKAGFPLKSFQPSIREVALSDYLTRIFYRKSKRFTRGGRGSGKSGVLQIDRPGQEVLERTSMKINEEYLEARFFCWYARGGEEGFSPGSGRNFYRIASRTGKKRSGRFCCRRGDPAPAKRGGSSTPAI